MKSIDEIRHRDNLRACLKRPCNCPGTIHAEQCMTGMMMMEAVQRTLSWILGEDDEQQELVDTIDDDCRRWKIESN